MFYLNVSLYSFTLTLSFGYPEGVSLTTTPLTEQAVTPVFGREVGCPSAFGGGVGGVPIIFDISHIEGGFDDDDDEGWR